MGRQLRKKPLRQNVLSIFGLSIFAFAAIGASSLSPSGAVFAQEEGRQFSAKIGEILNEIEIKTHNGDTEAALKTLESVIDNPSLTAIERSTIFQMLGKYSYELDRPGEAQHYFEKALAAGGLLPKEAENIRLVIAQLMIGNGQYREGAERLEAYLNSGGEKKASDVELLVNAWVQAEDYSRALPWAEKWFDAANPKERRHYDLLNFLFNNLGMQGRQADIVKEMINRWPEDKTLWDAWVYMLVSGGREREAFEITKMLYLGGGLTKEIDLLKLVQYFDVYDMPFQAAELLEREMATERIQTTAETQKRLGLLFSRAREYERAAPILELAARGSMNVDLGGGLAVALSKVGSCEISEQAFKNAITRGYDAGKAYILIGNCYSNQVPSLDRLSCNMTEAERAVAPITKARQAASAAFKSVPFGSSEAEDARKWIKFIEDEVEADERRCDFGHRPIHHCFTKIKQAYDAAIFTGEFELDDDSCPTYKPEYDAKYRVKPGE